MLCNWIVGCTLSLVQHRVHVRRCVPSHAITCRSPKFYRLTDNECVSQFPSSPTCVPVPVPETALHPSFVNVYQKRAPCQTVICQTSISCPRPQTGAPYTVQRLLRIQPRKHHTIHTPRPRPPQHAPTHLVKWRETEESAYARALLAWIFPSLLAISLRVKDPTTQWLRRSEGAKLESKSGRLSICI